MTRPADPGRQGGGGAEASPPRLSERPDLAGEALRRATRDAHRGIDEEAGWNLFEQRLVAAARPRGPVPLVAAASLGIVAGMTIMLVAQGGPSKPIAAPVAAPAVAVARAQPAPPPVVAPAPAPRAGSAAGGAVALEHGQNRVGHLATVTLSPDGSATVDERGGAPRVILTGGSLAVGAAPAAARAPVEVVVGAFRFSGERFRVSRGGDRLDLFVDRGRTAVFHLDLRLATVVAGWRWSARLDGGGRGWRLARDLGRAQSAVGVATLAARAEAAPDGLSGATAGGPREATSAASSPALAACGARGREMGPAAAEDCYAELAAGKGLEAEVALYEMGRGRLRLHDQPGALEAFQQLRRRFPNGTLGPEATLSVVEIMPRVGRHGEALALSAELLATAPGRGRAAELHLLRGNIHREALGDCAHAETEYAAAADTAGWAGDEAAFLRAGCLEVLGRPEAASTAYRWYLDRPRARRGDEARKRLGALGGPGR